MLPVLRNLINGHEVNETLALTNVPLKLAVYIFIMKSYNISITDSNNYKVTIEDVLTTLIN